MMSVTVVWKTYQPETIARGYWDQGMIEDLFAGRWNVPHFRTFNHVEDFSEVPPGEGAVVVVPARHNAGHIDKLNHDLRKLGWVVLILTGDEESAFDWTAVEHKNLRMWLMSPKPGLHPQDARMQYLGSGYPPQAREHLRNTYDVPRDRAFFFSGQDTHARRHECLEVLGEYTGQVANATEGFTQGLPHNEYYEGLAGAMLAPCPSGPVSVDSFRLYEALEAGCVPVADAKTPTVEMRDHWRMVFGEDPKFPIVDEWTDFRDLMNADYSWKKNGNRMGSWWEKKKRDLALRLNSDLDWVGAPGGPPSMRDIISVVMVTSPIASHPSLDIIQETLNSVRSRLPDSEIFILCDGVRPEQEPYTDRYNEYVSRLLWKARNEWSNVYPVVYDSHKHQAAMVIEFLHRETIKTPLMLFMEHDTPLVGEIPWEVCADFIQEDQTDLVRFHHEAVVPNDHWYLYPDGKEPIEWGGVPFIRTIQWSQRPHLASVTFYRKILEKYFSPFSRTMIEDTMHGAAQDPDFDGTLYIYYPPGDCKRSTHTDGRGNDPKYEMIT